MTVDHANPIHDSFCRCRACKPPLIEQERTHRVLVALGVLGALGMMLSAVVS